MLSQIFLTQNLQCDKQNVTNETIIIWQMGIDKYNVVNSNWKIKYDKWNVTNALWKIQYDKWIATNVAITEGKAQH